MSLINRTKKILQNIILTKKYDSILCQVNESSKFHDLVAFDKNMGNFNTILVKPMDQIVRLSRSEYGREYTYRARDFDYLLLLSEKDDIAVLPTKVIIDYLYPGESEVKWELLDNGILHCNRENQRLMKRIPAYNYTNSPYKTIYNTERNLTKMLNHK